MFVQYWYHCWAHYGPESIVDHATVAFFESLPTPASVIVSRICVSLCLLALLAGVYIAQARERIDRANRRLRHLEASHHGPGTMPWNSFNPRGPHRA
jgi:hypothetical protein